MARFYSPTEIIAGKGCLVELGRTAAALGDRAMIVCGQSFARRSGLLDRLLTYLGNESMITSIFDGVKGEADLDTVDQGRALAQQHAAEVIIGVGGGSAMDTAKAIAGLAPLPGTCYEYHNGRPLEHPGLAFVAIPTTAGTGSEATKNAVLIDPQSKVKKSIRDDSWFARVALMDPETTVSMPPEITANTGSDALCQAIEAYTSIGANAITDALAMQAISLIGQNLEQAFQHGNDLDAREQVMMGSLMAGMAMASARLGGVHGMAHPLGSHFDIPHGAVCGLLLPHTMCYNLDYAKEKYATVGHLMGLPTRAANPNDNALETVDHVQELLLRIGVPEHLSAFGVTVDDFPAIIAESLPSGSLKHNPRPLAAQDVQAILEMAL